MKELSKVSASWLEVGEEGDGQRVDNYLMRLLKGVPKSHIYRILRSGEVRVNSGRVGPEHKLAVGDRVRLPPVIRTATRPAGPAPGPSLASHVLFEDEHLLVLDKPAGLAVHGGSGVATGVIERLRAQRPECRFLELVHRLDRDTSGVLVLAKKRAALTGMHQLMRTGKVQKYYLTLVRGNWRNAVQNVKLPLYKYTSREGERRVKVSEEGAASHTIFRLQQRRDAYSLLEAELKTGRTHQIRVHLAHLGFPIAGDDKYGDFALNRELASAGFKRMFLHAHRLVFAHPATAKVLDLRAPLPAELRNFFDQLPQPADA